MKVKFSIIIPVYNAGNRLKKCIESILAQEYKTFEVIIIDDGSTDKSYELCKKYSKLDKRVKVYHKENGGVSSARNYGLKYVSGDYVLFVDSDDFIKKDCLLYCAKLIETKSCDIIKFNHITKYKKIKIRSHYTIEENNIIYKKDYKRKIYNNLYSTDDMCSVCWTVFSKDILKNIYFDEKIKLAEDFLFFVEVLNNSSNIIFLNKYFYYYVVDSESATRTNNIEKKLNQYIDLIMATKKIDSLLSYDYGRYKKSFRNFNDLIELIIYYYNYNEYKEKIKLYTSYPIIQTEIEYIQKNININKLLNLSYTSFTLKKITLKIKKIIKKMIN